MKRNIRKRMARGAKKFHAHLRKIVEASDIEINELCDAFRWSDRIGSRQGLSRE